MNLQPRIDSIAAGLEDEYQTALRGDLQPFERMIARMETALRVYRDRCETERTKYRIAEEEWN